MESKGNALEATHMEVELLVPMFFVCRGDSYGRGGSISSYSSGFLIADRRIHVSYLKIVGTL